MHVCTYKLGKLGVDFKSEDASTANSANQLPIDSRRYKHTSTSVLINTSLTNHGQYYELRGVAKVRCASQLSAGCKQCTWHLPFFCWQTKSCPITRTFKNKLKNLPTAFLPISVLPVYEDWYTRHFLHLRTRIFLFMNALWRFMTRQRG